MLSSKNTYFKKAIEKLNQERIQMRSYLELKGYKEDEIKLYIEAFDFFTKNPNDFDGATIVKDLVDLNGLDLDAMLHDYQYIVYRAAANFITKWQSDWMYAKGIERKGKGQYCAFTRLLVLTLIGVVFVPHSFLKRGKADKKSIKKQYNILIK
jgi:hypothetical protein